jgi:DNA-directed RNA polymerase subunit M/transcription elongation factor TFIIS
MQDIYCIKCNELFEAKEWEAGKCPSCGKEYDWEPQEYYDEGGNAEEFCASVTWD